MEATRRATVYLDTDVHRALRTKAAETETTISALVNDAVRLALAEDADDLAAIEERKGKPTRPFVPFLSGLKRSGKR